MAVKVSGETMSTERNEYGEIILSMKDATGVGEGMRESGSKDGCERVVLAGCE